MQYRIELSKKAQKNLDRIDKRFKFRILRVIENLAIDPYLGKPLEGEYKGCRSCRVWPYRIIYKIYKNELVVVVINVGHRQGVY